VRVGLVAPHIFMHRAILPHVIFSPGRLVIDLAEGLLSLGVDVTLLTPGPVDVGVPNITADMSYFGQELAIRGDSYMDLLKKHPFTFVTLARQVQSELIAKAFTMANQDELDIVHIYSNEEDIALPFTALCKKPVVFTHHDPFNFLVKYKSVFPKYAHLNWLSMSLAQRKGMPENTNWVGNIYHGLAADRFKPNYRPSGDYVAYLGRIIQPKGVHLAIEAAKRAGVPIKIAGKHYAGTHKDTYWQEFIVPHLGKDVEYVGFISDDAEKQEFLGNARALIVPSLFDEPFGMVMIEALACGTPVIGLDSGAIPEVITNNVTGFVVEKTDADGLAGAIKHIATIDRHTCRKQFKERFTLGRMCREHLVAYDTLCTTAL
jgi:glycosyltransferase involved in cell wall biosynthesis